MVKQRKLTIKKRKLNPANIQKKLVHDENYYPLNPEHSRRRLQKIAKEAQKKEENDNTDCSFNKWKTWQIKSRINTIKFEYSSFKILL